MPRPRVLIVDDDPRICAVIKRVAEGLDFEALCVDDPVRFECVYRGFGPEIVFLDLQMSSADGVELLRFLAGQDEKPQIVLASGQIGRASCRERV